MRKFLKIFEIMGLVIFVLGFTTCKWMTSTLSEEVEQEVKVATAEKIDLYVRFADNNFGTTTPSGATTQKIDVKFNVSAVPNNNYGFYEWAAFTTDVVDPTKNNPGLLYTNDEDYSDFEKLGSDVVKFEKNGRDATTTEVTILKKPDAGQIVIVPVVAKRAVLSNRNTYPKIGTEDVVRNQRIVLSFDKEMDFSSFVSNYNGTTYDWDKNKIQIRVYDQSGKYVGYDESYSYFDLPVQDEEDKKKIIIAPSRTNKIPRYAEIEIIISYDVYDTAGYNLTDSIEYYYSVGKTDDEGYPIFTEITAGRPRSGVQNTYTTDEDGKQVLQKYGNDWSDFYGYRDEGNQITELLPEDSLKLEDWTNTPINEIFKNRITDSVNLCVRIQDTINSALALSTTSSDKDISNFTVRVKHLVYPDGTEGSGKIYENNTDHEYFYDGMHYSDTDTDFEDGSPSKVYQTPDGAFAFTYYLPKDVPDGLLKIELFAEDVTGNNGKDKPYAVYVIKDTTAPSLTPQIDKIQSASAAILDGSKWYNETTIDGLKFRAASPIYDTFKNPVTNNDNVVAEKFRVEGNETAQSKIYWNFGSSADQMGGKKQIDNTGTETYSLATLKSVITSQGPISVHAQLEDDIGNASAPVKLNLDISYDTVAPSVVTITDITDGATPAARGYYPLTGTSGSNGKTFYTRNPSASMTVAADDSGNAAETATSSGIEGFFISDHVLSEAELAAKLTVNSEGHLSDVINTNLSNGTIPYDFAAGETANASKKDYYLYSVDRALNASSEPTKISVVQDTTGPGIIVTDTASKVYNTEKVWFKSSDSKAEKPLAAGTTGSVTGLVDGTYYYGASDENFPIKVKLQNECGEYDSGAYYFKVVKETGEDVSAYGIENPLSSDGEDVNLTTGDYKIVALDNLGNETETAVFHVLQDTAAPAVSSLVIHGKEANGTESTAASTDRAVTLTFEAADVSGTVNTGVRKIYLEGVDFSQMKVYKGETLLASGTDYVIESEDVYTVIALNVPVDSSSFKIEDIKLSEGEGQKTVTAYVSDAVRNRAADNQSYSIFLDATAPTVNEFTLISSDEDFADAAKETSTKSSVVSARLNAHDATSGIKRIYVTKVLDADKGSTFVAPQADSLLSATSVAKIDGVTVGSYDPALGAIVLTNPSISETDVTFEITGINLPDTSVQGNQTVAVYVFDNSGLRAGTPKTDAIIYDTTGPAIQVTDYASHTYDGTTLNKYRLNDTANNVTAVTDITGNVKGIVSGTYYYSKSETNGLKFKVELSDENITNDALVPSGTSSGAYRFYVDGASTDLKVSGTEIYLTAGNHTITALDNLGNATESTEIKIAQDSAEPVVSDVVIHGKIQDNADSTTATKENNVYVTFNVKDNTAASNDTGLLKVTLSGDADFASAKLFDGDTELTAGVFAVPGTGSVDFWFASPVTEAKSYTVKNVVLSDTDGTKTVTVKASDRTENECAGVSATIFKDATAPVTADVVVISTDEDKNHENKKTVVTNDEAVTLTFNVYDLTSGIKKITIKDDAGNSLLSTGADGSVLSAEYDGSAVTLNYAVSADGIVFTDSKTQISASAEKPFSFTLTKVKMPKDSDDKFIQGTNTFHVLAYDDVMNAADSPTVGSIIFDNVPPKPLVDFSASHFFNPKKSREKSGTSFNCYISDDGKVFFDNSSWLYFKASGDDGAEGVATAGFWKVKVFTSTSSSFTVTDPLNSTTNERTPENSYYKVDEGSHRYTKIFVFDAIGNCSELVSGVTEFEILDDDSKDSSSKKPEVSGYQIFKAGTQTEVEGYLNAEDTPVIDLVFDAMDKESGISYFDFHDSNLSSGGNIWNQIIGGSSNLKLEVSDDNGATWKTYKKGIYDSSKAQYYASVAGGATYDAAKGYFVDAAGNLDPYVYFNNYTTGEAQNRAFAFYEPLKPNITYKIKISNIDFANNTKKTTSENRDYWDVDINCNVYVYDCVQMACSGLEKKLVWDSQKPVIKNVEFVAASGYDNNFTSTSSLTYHDLVITYDEPNAATYGGGSGIEKIQLELTTNVGTVDLSTVDLLSSDDFVVSTSNTDGTGLTKTKVSTEATSQKTTSVIKIADSSIGSSVKGTSKKLYIKGLNIAGGVDQTETIKVTLIDRAGNVSDNTNNAASIGFDVTPPEMYKTDYDKNVQIIDGAPAVSYFKSFLGVPCVLSTHTSEIPYKAGSPKISVLPYPGDDKLDETVWDSGEGTELVLAFNKEGSGVKSIKLSPTCAGRGIFFNKDYIKVWIDNRDGTGKKELTYGAADGFTLGTPYSESAKFFQEIQFNSYNNCPRGENAAVYIQGVFFDYTQRQNVSGKYLLWCADAVITSFAGQATSYTGGETNGWAICAGLDWDTHEFTKRKITFADSSSSDSSFTDGETIDMTGHIQGKAVPGIFASGLWAINLDNAVFTEDTVFEIYNYWDSTYDWVDELNPNKLGSLTDPVKYKFAGVGSDFSKRNIPGDTVIASEFAEFDRNITNPANAKFSLSDDKHTMYLNIPIDPQDANEFKLSNLKLVTGLSDGDVNISAKLIKYSGLTNDPANRIYVKDSNKNPGASKKSYNVTRRTQILYDSENSLKSADSSDFAGNRTNSITLDTKDPVITWNGIDDSSTYYHSYKDSESGIVYYPSSDFVRLSYSMTDSEGSGIYGYYFDNKAIGATDTGSYITGTSNIMPLSSIGPTSFTGYLHIMDKVGHVVSRPVTYESDAENPNPAGPTLWMCDKTKPSIISGVTRHYYNDSTESGYVLKTSSTVLQVYLKGGVTDVTGSFSDTPVSGETGGVDQFFTDNGSGLYGTGISTSTLYKNIRTDFKWSTENTSLYIYDKVGNYNSTGFTVSKVNDSVPPELKLSSVTAPDGKTLYGLSGGSAISEDPDAPSVIYLNSTDDADGVTLSFSAADSGDVYTGVYKVTVGGTGLTDDAAGASATLANTTSFTTDSTNVTWHLGKGESKSEGSDNGLVRSITVTDWVGNNHTYWFKLVSDVTAPALTVSVNSPFASHSYVNTNGNRYFTNYDAENKKQVLFFGDFSQEVDLSAAGFADAVSGLPSSVSWYSDEACTTSVSKITLEQPVTWDGWTAVYGTPTATPSIIYTKDNVGNVLTVNISRIDTESLDSAAAGVYFCFTSVNTAAKIKVGTGQYIDGTSEVSLSSVSPVTLYTKSSNAVSVTPASYKGLKYSYVDTEDSSVKGGAYFRSTAKTANINIPDGKTYAITIASQSVSDISQTYKVKVINDSTPIDAGSLFKSHTYSNEEPYYTDASGTVTSGVYKKDIYVTGNYTLALPQNLTDGTGAGFWGWSTSETFNYSGQKITSVSISNGSTQKVYLYDNLGNKVEVQLTGKTIVAPAMKFVSAAESYNQLTAEQALTGSVSIATTKENVDFVIERVSNDSNCAVTVSPSVDVTENGSESTVRIPSDGTSYTITLTDFLNQTCSYTVIVNKDVTGPIFSGTAIVPLHENITISGVDDTYNYYSDGTGSTTQTIYSNVDSPVVLLTDYVTAASDDIGVKGWVDSSNNFLEKVEGTDYYKATCAEGENTFYAVDNLMNKSEPVKIAMVKDTTAPELGTVTLTATMVGGDTSSDTCKKYFFKDNKLYYSDNSGKRVYFTLSGLSDDVFLAGLTTGDDGVPGNGSIKYSTSVTDYTSEPGNVADVAKVQVVSGTAHNVFLTIGSDLRIYLRDKAGNVSRTQITLIPDTTAPTINWTVGDITQDTNDASKVYVTGSGNDKVVYVNASGDIKVTSSDSGSGLAQDVTTPVSFNNNEAILEYSDNVGNKSKVKLISDITKPKVGSVSYNNAESGEHTYSFIVRESGVGVSKIVLNKMDGAGSISSLNSANGILGYSLTTNQGNKTLTITLNSPTLMNDQTIELKMWNGHHSNWTEADIEVYDWLGNVGTGSASPLNASIFARAGTALATAGKAISRTTSAIAGSAIKTVRKAFVSEINETSAKVSKAEKVSSVTEAVTSEMVPADKKVTRKQKKEIQKAVTNLSERAAAFEKQNGLPEVSQVIGDMAENAELDVEKAEKVTLTESDNMSASLNKVEISIDNSETDDYNNGNIAKSVVILILSLISLSCVLFVLIRIKKSRK